MDPISLSTVSNIEKKNASKPADNSINSMGFIKSFMEVAKAQNLVVANGAELKELDFGKTIKGCLKSAEQEETEELENKILGFLGKIRKILKENK